MANIGDIGLDWPLCHALAVFTKSDWFTISLNQLQFTIMMALSSG
jgi:hypothetical protein